MKSTWWRVKPDMLEFPGFFPCADIYKEYLEDILKDLMRWETCVDIVVKPGLVYVVPLSHPVTHQDLQYLPPRTNLSNILNLL